MLLQDLIVAIKLSVRLIIAFPVIVLMSTEGAFGQPDPGLAPPISTSVDQNGVDLLSGPTFTVADVSIGVPGKGGLSFSRTWTSRHGGKFGNWYLSFGSESIFEYPSDPGAGEFPFLVSVGAASYYFVNENWSPEFGAAASRAGNYSEGAAVLVKPPSGHVTDQMVFLEPSGTKWIFQNAIVQLIEKPDGEIISYNYDSAGVLRSVTNNLGYMLHFDWASPADGLSFVKSLGRVGGLVKVTGIDTAVYSCLPLAVSCSDSTGANWPYVVFGREDNGATTTATDRLGNTSRYYFDVPNGHKLIGIRSPGHQTNDVSFTFSGAAPPTPGVNRLVTNSSAGQWTYDFNIGWDVARDFFVASGTVAGPNGYSGSWTTDYEGHLSASTINGRTTSYEYGGLLLTKVIGHDGDYVEIGRDARANITLLRTVPKPGSGLVVQHQYADYPDPTNLFCVNVVTCNKPLWVTVPGAASGTPSSLPKSDFTYDVTHGGVLTETKPAPGSGPYAAIRPQTRNTYAAVGGVTRVASVKSCRTTATCAGTADETVVETTYNTKRLPSLVVTRAGNNTTAFTATNARVAMTYSPQGDIESVDGPLSGAVDTAWTFYDTMRRPRVTVAPDPDGAGTLVYRASRTTYDADGQPVMVEQGSVTTPANCSAANNFCATTMTVLAKSTVEYDAYGRKTRENAYGSASTPQSVVQYSYDTAGRVECVATRMNSAVYGSLPTACTQSTAGSFGADPILRTTYTANGDPSVIQSGYGTTLVRNERTFTYLAPGQVATLKDAANNLTTYAYDGFDRLNKLSYPNTSVGAGTSSATDYEAYTYDAAGNKVTERRRDGLMIANTYDALNRLRLIDKPGAELDVTNSYDNFDHLITASQTGSSVTWAYDPLGRVTSEAQALGTVSYTYDTAGRRTQLTYPGAGFFANYQYFDDSRLKLIGLNGATTGTGVLATYYDDQLGRRTSMCRGTGTTTSCASVARTAYSYDAASRLSGLAHDLITGTSANDASWTLAYSPASQLTSRTATSALYEWPYSATFTDAYAVNGLNQYTTVAGASLAYDGRGNTTNDTTKTYTYDSSNMLTSASNGAALTYDPTGRLLSVAQSGVTTKFLYDGTRLIAEYNGSNALLRRYVHGDGVDDPIVWYDSSGTTNKRNLFKDERGSVIAADTGSAVTSLKYDEYGNATVTGSATPRFQYTGQAWLPELGLNYYKARIYNPDLGRFMQTDPIGTKDQVNLYAYVGNDPFNKTDPTGLCPWCIAPDTYWDLFNVGTGAISLAGNLITGNWAGALVDAGGIATDFGAAAVPGLPGGAGATIQASRAATQLAENAITGASRQAKGVEQLVTANPGKRVQTETYLRTADGKRAKDPLSGEMRRVDAAVIDPKTGTAATKEITGPGVNKTAQAAKEQRIIDSGGTFVRDRQTGKLCPVEGMCERIDIE